MLEKQCLFYSVPDEIVFNELRKVGVRNRESLRCTSKALQDVIQRYFVYITNCGGMVRCGVSIIAFAEDRRLPLFRLNFDRIQFSEMGADRIKCFTNLWKLKLPRDIIDADLDHIYKLTNLQSLDLWGCDKITADGLQEVALMTNLTELGLGYCKSTDDGLCHLSKLTKLQSIELMWNARISCQGLSYVTHLNLRRLNLDRCSQINDVALGYFTHLTNLRVLNLNADSILCPRPITDVGLAFLSHLTSLQELYFSACKSITDVGLNHLASLISLKILNLDFCEKITDIGINHLNPLTELTDLWIEDCKRVTESMRAQLKSLGIKLDRWIRD